MYDKFGLNIFIYIHLPDFFVNVLYSIVGSVWEYPMTITLRVRFLTSVEGNVADPRGNNRHQELLKPQYLLS